MLLSPFRHTLAVWWSPWTHTSPCPSTRQTKWRSIATGTSMSSVHTCKFTSHILFKCSWYLCELYVFVPAYFVLLGIYVEVLMTLKVPRRITHHYKARQFVATHWDGLFWGCFRRILTYECFWSFYQPFSVLARHLSTGSTKSALLMLPRQNKAQQSSISLLRLQAATQPLRATDWERARAFVLEETSLAADKESCLALL